MARLYIQYAGKLDWPMINNESRTAATLITRYRLTKAANISKVGRALLETTDDSNSVFNKRGWIFFSLSFPTFLISIQGQRYPSAITRLGYLLLGPNEDPLAISME